MTITDASLITAKLIDIVRSEKDKEINDNDVSWIKILDYLKFVDRLIFDQIKGSIFERVGVREE